jgi:predicted DCC family thiol-disulfide oxidoreductase YuxK
VTSSPEAFRCQTAVDRLRRRGRLYERIAKNRYAIFGRKDSCEIPSAAMRARMIG